MKRKLVKLVIIVSISFILCINNGCLTAFYSAKVAKQGNFHIGLGTVNESSDSRGSMFYSSLFCRYGLPNDFDIGVSYRTFMVIPTFIMSGRKQFNFNNEIIDAITIDIGCGGGYFLLFNEFNCYVRNSFIKDEFAVTLGYGKCYRWTERFPDGGIWYEDDHVFTTRVSYEIKMGKINVIPFIYYKAMQKVGYGSLINLISHADNTYSHSGGWQAKYYGFGISFYFNFR